MKNDAVLRLFSIYADDLYRFALSYTGSKCEAEDIVQDVFVKLISKPLIIRPEQEKAYLLRMTANLCKDYLKSPKYKENVDIDALGDVIGVSVDYSKDDDSLFKALSQTGTFQNEFPINRKAFDEVGADCVDIFNHQIDQEYSWQTGADKSSLYTKKDDLNTLKKVAESLDHIYKSDADIDIIVFEEIQPYLAGDKSLDEVIKIMNDRARTVMNERR